MSQNTADTTAVASADENTQEYASIDDAIVSRDEDGELLPEDVETASIGLVEVLPMPYGAIEEHFGSSGTAAELDSEQVAQVLDNGGRWTPRIITPDHRAHAEREGYTQTVTNPNTGEEKETGHITGDYVREHFKPLSLRDYLMAVLDASDVEADVMADNAGNAQVDLDEGNEF